MPQKARHEPFLKGGNETKLVENFYYWVTGPDQKRKGAWFDMRPGMYPHTAILLTSIPSNKPPLEQSRYIYLRACVKPRMGPLAFKPSLSQTIFHTNNLSRPFAADLPAPAAPHLTFLPAAQGGCAWWPFGFQCERSGKRSRKALVVDRGMRV